MPGRMRPFTFDVERTELAWEEKTRFACIVQAECFLPGVHAVSQLLSYNRVRCSGLACDDFQRQVLKIWRAEARL